MRLDCDGLSHAGKVRAANEDHFAIAALHKTVDVHRTNLENVDVFERLRRPDAHLLMVADGVGGASAGAAASAIAIQTVAEYVADVAGCYQDLDVQREHEFLDQLTGAVQRSHQRLAETFGPKGGPATTLTMIMLVWPRAYLVHVGDSRAYLLRRGRLRQVTQDQTVGDVLVDIGAVSEAQAKKSGLYDVLASAVGGELTPAVGVLDLVNDDQVLLCTDGLTKHVPEDAITRILGTSSDATTACGALVDAALEGGGTDNVTVIVARGGS